VGATAWVRKVADIVSSDRNWSYCTVSNLRVVPVLMEKFVVFGLYRSKAQPLTPQKLGSWHICVVRERAI
jgi:hypothetical protein